MGKSQRSGSRASKQCGSDNRDVFGITGNKMRGKLVVGLRLVILSALLVGLQAGCGKKGPPVPPRRYMPPAVTDLSYQLDGPTLTLSWSVPEAKDGDAAAPVG
ncbi:MAG: hypothetical protein WAJ95_10055, partial [Desulfobacterales bacterium]